MVDVPSAINGIIGRPFLKALKAATSIYHLTMKFPTAEGTGEVRSDQYDSRKCYIKSLLIIEQDNKSLRASVGKVVASSLKRLDIIKQAHA